MSKQFLEHTVCKQGSRSGLPTLGVRGLSSISWQYTHLSNPPRTPRGFSLADSAMGFAGFAPFVRHAGGCGFVRFARVDEDGDGRATICVDGRAGGLFRGARIGTMMAGRACAGICEGSVRGVCIVVVILGVVLADVVVRAPTERRIRGFTVG